MVSSITSAPVRDITAEGRLRVRCAATVERTREADETSGVFRSDRGPGVSFKFESSAAADRDQTRNI